MKQSLNFYRVQVVQVHSNIHIYPRTYVYILNNLHHLHHLHRLFRRNRTATLNRRSGGEGGRPPKALQTRRAETKKREEGDSSAGQETMNKTIKNEE